MMRMGAPMKAVTTATGTTVEPREPATRSRQF